MNSEHSDTENPDPKISSIEKTLPKLQVGETVRLRKAHPCGGHDWRIWRIADESGDHGDIGLDCLTCGRRVLLLREEFNRRKVTVYTAIKPNTK